MARYVVRFMKVLAKTDTKLKSASVRWKSMQETS